MAACSTVARSRLRLRPVRTKVTHSVGESLDSNYCIGRPRGNPGWWVGYPCRTLAQRGSCHRGHQKLLKARIRDGGDSIIVMLVSSGAARALPLGIVDKLESRMFEVALSSSSASAQRSQPQQAREEDEDLPKREVLDICLSVPNPTISRVDKSSARIEWVDVQRPASLPSTCNVAYELELKQVSTACCRGAIIPRARARL